MERSRNRMLWLAALLVVVVGVHSGCSSVLFTVAYALKGAEVEPEFNGLKEKKIAIVCRPMVELRYAHGNVSTQVAGELGKLFKQKVKKSEIISADRVAEWTDANEWSEYTEIGEALNADMVVGIDLEQFELLRGQTLYQGTANVVINVYDMANGGELVFQRHMPQLIYPPNTGIPSSEMPQDQFRRMFVHVLADHIGRYFYPHDPRADVARDADTL